MLDEKGVSDVIMKALEEMGLSYIGMQTIEAPLVVDQQGTKFLLPQVRVSKRGRLLGDGGFKVGDEEILGLFLQSRGAATRINRVSAPRKNGHTTTLWGQPLVEIGQRGFVDLLRESIRRSTRLLSNGNDVVDLPDLDKRLAERFKELMVEDPDLFFVLIDVFLF